jgi:hypothetical protein
MSAESSSLGYGLGLRTPYYQAILEQRPAVDWFEVISENGRCACAGISARASRTCWKWRTAPAPSRGSSAVSRRPPGRGPTVLPSPDRNVRWIVGLGTLVLLAALAWAAWPR